MKKILSFLILNFSIFVFAQSLNMQNSFPLTIELPKKLNNNDIVLIYETNEGWSAYDYISYYFLDEKGLITQYNEERPKSYLNNKNLEKKVVIKKISEEHTTNIKEIIKSEELSKLLAFKQEDFKIKINGNLPPPCFISDAIGYKLTIIKDKKLKSYDYYAPYFYLEKCQHQTINRKVLQTFVDVLELFK